MLMGQLHSITYTCTIFT